MDWQGLRLTVTHRVRAARGGVSPPGGDYLLNPYVRVKLGNCQTKPVSVNVATVPAVPIRSADLEMRMYGPVNS